MADARARTTADLVLAVVLVLQYCGALGIAIRQVLWLGWRRREGEADEQ